MLIYSVVVLCPQFSCWFAFLLIVTGAVKAKALLVLRRTMWCHLVLFLRKDFIHRLTLSLPPEVVTGTSVFLISSVLLI